MINRPLRSEQNNQHSNSEMICGRCEPLLGNDGVDDGVEAEEAPQPRPADEPVVEHEEARMAVAVQDPYTPTAAEKAKHDLTHANFRSWCRACVQGRGMSASHFRQDKLQQEEMRVPTVHVITHSWATRRR